MEEKILSLLENKKYAELKESFTNMEAADIAILFESVPTEKLPLLFRLLPKELAAEVFVELESDMQELLISGFSDSELKEVWEELYVDDAVDIIEEMPANVVKRILRHSDSEMRQSINEILNYPKDSAGSIMTTEYVDLKENMTVDDAFTHIRRTGVDKETIYTCYVTDSNRKLMGLISVKDLLLADKSALLTDIMETNIIYANTIDDKEDVARQFGKYDFLAIPVVDKERRLVGIVTVDDAIDVLEEENTEDIEKMAAITPSDKPYLKTGIFETYYKRIPWLMLLMLSATFTGKIISSYESALRDYAILTSFIPMLTGTGGNAGGQTSASIIRGISLNEIAFKDIFRVIWKELRVALICGITLSVTLFAKLILVDRIEFKIAIVVALAIISAVALAKMVGCMLPLFAKKIGFDPAVMANPLLSTMVDVVTLAVFFKIAVTVLRITI